MAYQHMKNQDLDPKESGAHNPYRILLTKITSASSQRLRLKSAVNVWRKTVRREIDAIVKAKQSALDARFMYQIQDLPE